MALVGYHLASLHILVVDDNKNVCELVRDVLDAFSITVVFVANSGNAAYRLFEEKMPDIVITDLKMPDGDGLELVQRIRQGRESPNPTVPIIMMSGYSDREKVLAARDIGVTEFLCKPFSVKSMYARLVAVIERTRPFVKVDSYFGPDRRRSLEDFKGEDRRDPENSGASVGSGIRMAGHG